MATAPKHALGEVALAQMAGVSVNTWRSHKSLGCPVPRRKADLDAWLRQYQAWRVANGKVPSTERKLSTDPEALKWQRERMKWLAVEKKWSVALMAKKLVQREEVERRTVQQVLAVRQALNDMVRKLASRLYNAASPEAIELELQAEVDHILASFAQGMERVPGDASGAATLQEIVGTQEEVTDE